MSHADQDADCDMSDSLASSSPPLLAAQACKRCHSHKKRCDRKLPQCSGCALAKVECEVELRMSDRRIRSEMAGLRNETTELRRRVAALELDLKLKDEELSRHLATAGTNVYQASASRRSFSLSMAAANDTPVLSSFQHPLCLHNLLLTQAGLPPYDPSASPLQTNSNSSFSSLDTPAPLDLNALPSLEETRSLALSLLDSGKYSPHTLEAVITHQEIENDLQRVYGEHGLTIREYGPSRFRCFILVYLAMCFEQAITGLESTFKSKALLCRSFALQELRTFALKEDLDSVQALMLLCSVVIHEPDGPNLWQILGIAARTAVAINLHRRDDIFLSTIRHENPAIGSGDIAVLNEKRKNLFWSLYGLDRLCMFILHKPTAIRDEDIDIELPSVFLSSGQSDSQNSIVMWSHNLVARRLYGAIYDSLYAVSVSANQPIDVREAVVASFVQQIHQWYSASRLRSTSVPFSNDTVKRQMIMSLHRPSPLIPNVSSAFIIKLLSSAKLSIDLFYHFSSRKELSVHWVNLYQVFDASVALLYCAKQCHTRQDLVPIPTEELELFIDRCRALLRQMGRASPSASKKYQELFETLVVAMSTTLPTPDIISAPNNNPPTDYTFLDFDNLLHAFVGGGNSDVTGVNVNGFTSLGSLGYTPTASTEGEQ